MIKNKDKDKDKDKGKNTDPDKARQGKATNKPNQSDFCCRFTKYF